MIASYDEAIEQLSKDIDSRIEQYRETAEKLQTIPGVKKRLLKPSLPKSDAPSILPLGSASRFLGRHEPRK